MHSNVFLHMSLCDFHSNVQPLDRRNPMTPKELRRLRRSDLMEMLLQLSKENLQLRQDLEDAHRQLEEKQIKIEEAGSLAEAALRLNGIFEAAQAACDQ